MTGANGAFPQGISFTKGVNLMDMRDVALAQHVQSLIGSNQRLATLPIRVTAADGVVYLSGRVDNTQHRTEAELLASSATGVKQVVNQLGLIR
ncbi:MAG TPA: BON domain-containing protein [Clostridia bacterium]|nr:BON domain-containing protein [Clostridia bacterium]